jgi:universal stress protein A
MNTDRAPRRILVALELAEPAAEDILTKAKALLGAKDVCDVLHVVEPTTVAYSVDPTMMGTMYERTYEEAMAAARLRLEALCAPFGIAPEHCLLRYGRIAHEVHAQAQEGGYDTLMIGSHGWSGWRRILGSKASSILHGVPIDCWVFKVRETEAE